MKTAKKLVIVLLSLCLVLGLAGCGSLKDGFLDGYNDLLQFTSRHALTRESDLQGEKATGDDVYVGSYTAEYENLNGEEYIFGGTGLERKDGNELTVTYTLRITSGSASLNWIHSGSEYTLSNEESSNTTTVTLGSGDHYIVLKGENFTGSLELEVR